MKVLIKNIPTPKSKESIKVKKTLQPVDRSDSNLEAEKGEVIVGDFSHTGFPELYVVGGERHYNNGTPLNAPENSFIFSRDKSLKLKNEEIQESFGKREKKVGYTFAEIAKQYDINKYRKILADPDTDRLQRETAEDMIKNYNEKLGKLALVQESMKGFDNGLPFISIPYLESMGIDPAKFIHAGDTDEPETITNSEEEIPQAKYGGGFKVRILKKPSYQKGGPKKPDTEFAYNTDFYNSLAEKLGVDVTALLPGTLAEQKGQVQNRQEATGKGSYGRKDWTSPELFPDFRNRNAWYFAQKPEFNPRDKKDVKDFQNAYNVRAENMGLKPYFITKPDSKYSADGKFGEVTYSVPDLDIKAKQVVQSTQPAAVNVVQSDLQKPVINAQTVPQDNPFWTQDLVKLTGAIGDKARIKKYMPWQAGYNVQLPEATYYDPTRELAANAEQANIASTAASTFAGPQSLGARTSEIQGQALENAANVLGKYNNLNVSTANSLETARTNILNSDSVNRANLATGLFDKTTMVNQQFDNAKNMARQNIRQSFVDAWTNRGKTQGLNAMNKQYRVDPVTGFVTMTGVPGKVKGDKQAIQVEATFNKLMGNPNLKANPELAYKMALKQHGMIADQDPNISYQQYQK